MQGIEEFRRRRNGIKRLTERRFSNDLHPSRRCAEKDQRLRIRRQECNVSEAHKVRRSSVNDAKRRARRVVRCAHPRCCGWCASRVHAVERRVEQRAERRKECGDRLAWDAARTEQARRLTRDERDNTRFHADARCATEQHRINASVELLQHMFRRGGGELTKEIGARRSDRRSGGANQRARKVVVWESHANGWEARPNEAWDAWCCRRDDCERPRPEGVGEKRDTRIFECGGGEDE
jgi:hypothetical protein